MNFYVRYSELVGSILKDYRVREGKTQGDISKYVGVGVSTYSRIECGDSSVSVVQLHKASYVMGLTSDAVLSEVNDLIAGLEGNDPPIAVIYGEEEDLPKGYIPLTGKGLDAVIKNLRCKKG